MRENCSAITCSVTVLPVPVAPVMQPCRLAMPGRIDSTVSPDLSMGSGSIMAEGCAGQRSERQNREAPGERSGLRELAHGIGLCMTPECVAVQDGADRHARV